MIVRDTTVRFVLNQRYVVTAMRVTPNKCIPHDLREKLDDAGYSEHGFLLKVAFNLGRDPMRCVKQKHKNT